MIGLVEIKNFTHTVLKNDDIGKYLSKRQKKQLIKIEATIRKGRKEDGKPYNSYYVCNEDEPYANEVITAILYGESKKETVCSVAKDPNVSFLYYEVLEKES